MTIDSHKPRSRREFWLLLLVFFVPLVLAFALYYGADRNWWPTGRTNHGDLIDPARPLPALALLRHPSGQEEMELWRGKWSLVFIGEGACDTRCREALVKMRQVRLALNDDMSRVQRVFVALGACCDDAYLKREHAGLVVARADEPRAQPLLAVFPRYNAVPAERAGRIYIVDPLGNLMMSYAPEVSGKGVLEDLKKLLKLSHIG